MTPPLSDNPPTRVLARPVVETPQTGLVRLSWSQPGTFTGRVQVYVDAELYNVTTAPADRALWLVLDPTTPHRIDLLAVDDAAEAWTDHSGALRVLSGQVRPVVTGDLRIPIGSALVAKREDGTTVSRPMYRAGDDRPGFGARFGEGGFGYDLSIGPGLGRGALGFGPLGAGGEPINLRPQRLGPGSHTLELSLIGPDGVMAEVGTLTAQSPELPAAPTAITFSPDGKLSWA
ncbi:MAG: hypothetical protein AAGC44_02085 [Planctomycetota bacterium]